MTTTKRKPIASAKPTSEPPAAPKPAAAKVSAPDAARESPYGGKPDTAKAPAPDAARETRVGKPENRDGPGSERWKALAGVPLGLCGTAINDRGELVGLLSDDGIRAVLGKLK